MRVGDPHSPKKCLQVLLLSSKILPYLVCSNSSATWLLISCLVVLYCEKALSCCTLYRTEKNIKLATRTLERTRIHQRSAETCAHICGRFDSSKFPQKHQTKYISATRASKFSGSINLTLSGAIWLHTKRPVSSKSSKLPALGRSHNQRGSILK